MSLKRVVLIAAFVALAMPAVVSADGITFGFVLGRMYAVQPGNSGGSGAILGTVTTNDSGSVPPQTSALASAQLHYVSRFSGTSIPAGPALPPQILPTFGTMVSPPGTFNFGSAVWTTGAAIATSAGAGFGSTTYSGSGSSLVIYGNGSLPGTGTPLFSGSFIGPTTLTLIGKAVVPNPTCTSCQLWYNLAGPVGGIVDPGLMALLNMPAFGTQSGQGLFFSFVVGFVGGNDVVGNVEGGTTSVVVPEPGTLALFGTGLIGVAGFIRRRIKA